MGVKESAKEGSFSPDQKKIIREENELLFLKPVHMGVISMNAEVAVIGAGPGGYVAAIRAAQLGKDVVVIEKEDIGGICLNHGCIPTKALKRSAEAVHNIERARSFGIQINDYEIDFQNMMRRKDSIVRRLTGGIEYLLEENDIKVIKGKARLEADNRVFVEGGEEDISIEAEDIIIATGSKPLIPPIEGTELEGVMTSRELLQIDEIPEKLAVVGGGYIGVEFASIFSELGSEVYLIEMLPGLLPNMDHDLSQNIEKAFSRELEEVYTDTTVERIEETGEDDEGLRVELSDEDSLHVDTLLMATGRTPTPPEISEDLEIIIGENGEIDTDEKMRTGEDNIYAIGDVTGDYMLAHAASQEGIVAAACTAGRDKNMDYEVVPAVVFSTPEIASVGMTESEAEKKTEIAVGEFPYQANGKALAERERKGFVKVIADEETDEILGIHICGLGASSLIGEGAAALSLDSTAGDLADTIHAHPTLPETIMEAAEDVHGISIHKP